jgi:hypothetical protein
MLVCPNDLTIWSSDVTLSTGGSLDISLQEPLNDSSQVPAWALNIMLDGAYMTNIGNIGNASGHLSKESISILLSSPDADDLSNNYFRVNSLEVINARLDSYGGSIIKPFVSGYVNDSYTNTTGVSGVMLNDGLALTASTPVLFVVIGLVVVVLAAMTASLALSGDGRVPFDLKHVSEALKENGAQRSDDA